MKMQTSVASNSMVRRISPDLDQRTLNVLDIENLAGEIPSVPQVVGRIREWFLSQAFGRPGDHFLGACSHLAIEKVGFAWPEVRWRARSGPDGADLALLEAIREERVAERFSKVVIASGDGIFAPVAADLAAAGVEVVVVSRPASLSRRLELAATRFVPLSLHRADTQTLETAAA